MKTRFWIAVLSLLACAVGTAGQTVTNAGFEETAPTNAAPGWGWQGNMQASYRTETTDPHSGGRCVVLTNATDMAPWMMSSLTQTVAVLPGVRYELSGWVRGVDVGRSEQLNGGAGAVVIPSGTFGWRRLSTVFLTALNQTQTSVGIILLDKCKELAVDDIALREVGEVFDGKGISGHYAVPGRVNGDGAANPLRVSVESELEHAATLRVVIRAGEETLFKADAVVKPGTHILEWVWNSGKTRSRRLELSLQVLGANSKVLAAGKKQIEKMSDAITLGELDRAQARLKEFDALYSECKTRNIPLDYPTVTKAVFDQLMPFAREDLLKGEQLRADYAAQDFSRLLDRSIAEMKAYLKTPSLAPDVPRYHTGPTSVDGLRFTGTRKHSDGAIDRGPVFFCGYGHFGQVRQDIDRFYDYGTNIIQIEFGPSMILTSEGDISLEAANDLAALLDRAAERNTKVNVLLSPHYFPDWAKAKWPQMMTGGYSFCVDMPEAMYFMQRYLRALIPVIKDKPALHSLCLTNEPHLYWSFNCPNTKPLWAGYLTQVHGDIKTLNERYGTTYAAFKDVPMPGNHSYDLPQYYDWCIFTQRRLGEWHEWLADVIHEMAPDVPIHTKIMGLLGMEHTTSAWGIDPEIFGRVSDINGNDCAVWPGGGGWAVSWQNQNMWYDLQRSLAHKPIFNSENHISPDGSTTYTPPGSYRTALWQGAVHGQGATTLWAWERTFDHGSPFYGSVMHRPGCTAAVGTTCLDLNRFADEVTALQEVRAPVGILYSMTSSIKTFDYKATLDGVYTALNFCGVKVDFVSEKQLAAGGGAAYKMIVVPGAAYVPDSTLDALAKLPAATRVVLVGDCLTKDPYGNARPAEDARGTRDRSLALAAGADPRKELWPALRKELGRMNALPEVAVVDATTGAPVWGVEWLPVRVGRRTLVNMVNLLDEPVRVKILKDGGRVQGRDMLSIGGGEVVQTLQPIAPVLAKIGD